MTTNSTKVFVLKTNKSKIDMNFLMFTVLSCTVISFLTQKVGYFSGHYENES